MSLQNPENPMSNYVRQLQGSQRPIERWAAASLDEIYLHDEFSLGRLKGESDMNLKYTPRALRVIGWHEGKYAGLGLILFDARRAQIRSLGRELRNEVSSLPNVSLPDKTTLDIVATTLLRQGKQTVAALEISASAGDGSKVVQVLYPKFLRSLVLDIFGSLGIALDETSEREMAMGIAIKFLKSVPFLSSEAKILTPENLE